VPKVTLGARVHISPAGEDSDSITVPVSPLTAVTVIVEVPDEPTRIWPGDTAPAAMVKSTTWKRIVPVEWLRVASVPVTVTV
jgi:hypothetical protein